jgi:nucleoside-diphosphate-sugar epimerase
MAGDRHLTGKILITGANGFIGSNLCRWFLGKGYEVYGLVRRTCDLHFLEGLPVNLVYGELCDPRSFNLPAHLDYVVHAASVVSDQASEAECDGGIYGITVNLVRKILDKGLKIRRFVYISTTRSLGYRGTNLSEENPGRSTDFMPYARAKKSDRAYLLEKAGSDRLPVVILRPGDTYGPNDRTALNKILRAAERGVPITVGHGRYLFAYCYIDNLCQAVELAMGNDRAVGKAYTVTDGAAFTWGEFFSALQGGLGIKHRRHMPVWLAMFLASSLDMWKLVAPGFRPEVNRYRIRRITTDTTYDISKTVAELGYRPDHNTAKQVERIVDWYLEERKKGYIK